MESHESHVPGLPPLPSPPSEPELEELELLRRIAAGITSSPTAMVVTDEAVAPGLNADFQLPGIKRVVIPRAPTGGEFAVPSAEYVRICRGNRKRLGGTIVNDGEFPIRLVLAAVGKAAGPALSRIYLAKGGGSWDFRLGPLLWAGHVAAIAIGGVSSLSLSEV
jgi:hypothetical protein